MTNNSNWYGWFVINDHTPSDAKGRFLLVNASYVAGEFFKIPVSGLCENTTYEFSSWLINLLPSYHRLRGSSKKGKPINVTFEIWDSTGTRMLKSGNTGNIQASNAPNWEQYGLVFQTEPGQTSVILKMRNNGVGGYGNDLAIDDIMFRTCGDAVVIKDSVKKTKSISIYKNELPYSSILTASPDFSVFSTHFYQWQKSENGTSWVNVTGENSNSLSVSNINKTSYYRVLVAEDAINLLNSSCNSASEVYKVNVLTSNNPKKKPPKPRKRVVKLEVINVNSHTEIQKENIKVNVPELKEEIKATIVGLKGDVKTKKQVIIVKNGHQIINDKVWVDGAIGKFVQTGEKIIKLGDVYAGTIIEETIYYKAIYGYNSSTRTYSIQE